MAIPTSDYSWATNAAWSDVGQLWDALPSKTEPIALRASGYMPYPLAADHLNWQFNTIGEWLAWLELRVQGITTGERFDVNAGIVEIHDGAQFIVTGDGAGSEFPIEIWNGAGMFLNGSAAAQCVIDLVEYAEISLGGSCNLILGNGSLVVAESGSLHEVESGAEICSDLSYSPSRWRCLGNGDIQINSGGDLEVNTGGEVYLNTGSNLWAQSGSTCTIGGTLTIGAGAVTTVAGSFTFGSTCDLEITCQVILTGEGQIVERTARHTSDTNLTLSCQTADVYLVEDGVMTAGRTWNLPETSVTAIVGSTLTVINRDPDYAVTVHGALEDWTIRKVAGTAQSMTFKRVNNGTVERWYPVGAYITL